MVGGGAETKMSATSTHANTHPEGCGARFEPGYRHSEGRGGAGETQDQRSQGGGYPPLYEHHSWVLRSEKNRIASIDTGDRSNFDSVVATF